MAERIQQGPPWLQSTINQHADIIEENYPVEGEGILLTKVPGRAGTVISVKPTSDGATPAKVYTPFQVITQAKPSEPGSFQFAVCAGRLWPTGTRDPDGDIDVTGIPSQADQKSGMFTWYDWSGDTDVIYLDGSVDPTMEDPVTGVQVNSGSQGGSFDDTADAWSSDDAWLSGTADDDISTLIIQDEFCKVLAFLTADTDGSPIVDQICTSNLAITSAVVDSQPALYPVAVG